MTKRFIASLVFLAVLSGLAAPPAHAILGIGLGGGAEVAKLVAILAEVKRIRDVARQTLATALIMKKQAEYYASFSDYLIKPRWPISWQLVSGAHCMPGPWPMVFNTGLSVDHALGTIRRGLEWDCASISRTPHSVRALADLTVLLDNITRHNFRDAGKTRGDVSNAPIDQLLDLVEDVGETGRSMTANLQKAAAAAATAAALARDQAALTSEDVELQTMLLQLDRDELVIAINSEVTRHRTHDGTFRNIQAR